MLNVRPAAVAGAFYPAQAETLRHLLAECFAAAKKQTVPTANPTANPTPHPATLRPKALIVPHAGYIYSGPIAASAYALLRPLHAVVRRVVLLGPVHRVWVSGLALPGVTAFATPLGQVPLDQAAIAAIADLPQISVSVAAHAQEHSLEVHLPFLQSILDDFSLVPLAVGDASPEAVAEVLDRLWGGEETLIVISSDLSHFLTYAEAQHRDAATAAAILKLEGHLVGEQACGAYPINGMMLAARRHGLTPHLLDMRNSGDTAGDRNRVVGYASFALVENNPKE
jgi:AmmeMemoRadiSam system protein B